MNSFEYSRWDGTQEFSPQSADKLFDQIGEYLLDHGEPLLDCGGRGDAAGSQAGE